VSVGSINARLLSMVWGGICSNNRPDEAGNVRINPTKVSEEPLYIAPEIARVIKPHQVLPLAAFFSPLSRATSA
jgi:hypothetical protein